MTLLLLPDLGDLYRLQPQLNAGTVVELLRWLGAGEVLWASSPDPDHPLRDALPAAGIRIRDGFAPDWAWALAEREQLEGFLQQYPQGRERLMNAARAEQELAEVLTAPLTAERALSREMLDATRTFHGRTRDLLDEGPGTLWRLRRLDEVAAALAGQTGVALAALDDLPELLQKLPDAALPDLHAPQPFAPGETSRLRALADRALQLHEEDDLSALLDALARETGDAVTPRAELDLAAANIYLAVGDLKAARAMLEGAAHALQDGQPRSLAGLTLARLGQVRDAQGERDLALRTYRAVLALSYAPAVALAAAERGLQQPFTLDLQP